MRTLFLAAALGFVALFGGLTIVVAINDGVSAATVLALIVIGMFGLGIYGALRTPPE